MEFGLSRITRLLQNTKLSWKAIHVAGTNGKGSLCAYTSAMLYASNVKCGRFTSPHLVDRWDCITINEAVISSAIFREVENTFRAKSQEEGIGASEFEVLTATAFEIFNREHVEVGVVEVGLGGTHDATNVLDNSIATVITKIGHDHQEQLGHSIASITKNKAGIMRPHVPCFADGSNVPAVLGLIKQLANRNDTPLVLIPEEESLQDELAHSLLKLGYMPFQITNIRLALQAALTTLTSLGRISEMTLLHEAIAKTVWPGRLQFFNVSDLVQRQENVLLDGAHNPQAAASLGQWVDARLRHDGESVTWLVAISSGKDVNGILKELLRSGDKVIAMKFPPVVGMPWVKPVHPNDIVQAAQSLCSISLAASCSDGMLNALQEAVRVAKDGPLVVAGSLYLIAEIFRLRTQLQMTDHPIN